MKPVSPHHLLSAYLDGELSANEREQVDHLLEMSESARQELRELERIGDLLRQLPRESPPKTFASTLLDRCLSDTGVFENDTQILKIPDAKDPPNSSPGPRWKRQWLGMTIVGISATALGMLSMIFWPNSSPKSPNEVALRAPEETETATSAFRSSREPMPMAAGDAAPALVLNEARSEPAGQARERNSDQQPLAAEMSQTMRTFAADAATSQPLRREKDNLKEIPFDQVVEALDQSETQIAVVKLQVGNRQEALKELQTLFNQHQIAQTPKVRRQQAGSEADEANAGNDSSIVAVYVEASEDRLAAAIRDLQRKAAFQKATIDAPIAVAGLDVFMPSPTADSSAPPRSRMRKSGGAASRFGGARRRASQGNRKGQSPEPAATTAAKAEKSLTESAHEPAKSFAEDTPNAPPSPAGNAPTRRTDSADPNPYQKTPGASKPGEAQAKTADEKPSSQAAPEPAPSTQREVTFSARLLSSLQKQVATSPSPKKESIEDKAASSGQRVQVLFILVDQPAGKPVPADTDGPANR